MSIVSAAVEPPKPFELDIPPPRMMTSNEELQLARMAFSRSPDSETLRFGLANLLLQLDHFDEVIPLLQSPPTDSFRLLDLLAAAFLSRETPQDDLAAKTAALRALSVATDSFERSNALTTLAKAHIRLSEFDQARTCLAQALANNNYQKDAFKRVAALHLQQDQPHKVLEHADQLFADGVTHSRVLGAQSLALTQLGLIEEARHAQGLDRFLLETDPPPPAGWPTLQAFNDELALEISNHPDMRYERYGTASAYTWRVDQPALKRSRILPELQKLIQREVVQYVDGLPLTGHPFLLGRPRRAILRNWCVITEGSGYETWHVHQNGWLSGVYYVHVQDHIAHGTGPDGCIAFGVPEDVVGPDRARDFGERICRPHSGLMMIFPSHAYHRTFPHHGDGRRICYAFDIIPQAEHA